MNTKALTILICAFSSAVPLLAQSNEVALQLGRTVFEGRRIDFSGLPGEAFDESNGFAGGIVYNRKLIGGNVASLHFHLPLFAFEDQLPDESRFNQSNLDTSSLSGFITPGVMIRFLEPFPVQPYIFGGVGYARLRTATHGWRGWTRLRFPALCRRPDSSSPTKEPGA